MTVTVKHSGPNGVSFDTIYYGIDSIKEVKEDFANQVGDNEFERITSCKYNLMKGDIYVGEFTQDDYNTMSIEFDRMEIDKGY